MKKLNIQKVEEVMINKGININDLCKKLGVSRVTVHRYLKGKGKMQIKTINSLGAALGVEPSSIIRGK